VKVLINNWDALRLGMDTGDIINGGTFTGTSTAAPVIDVNGADTSITGAYINGPASQGIYLNSMGACAINNVFSAGTNLVAAISSNSGNMGSDNVLNGAASSLTAGTCSGP
jgi:hypothetical protein